ncbi:hypothetical protein KFK09_006270 [Dendrobium nobile]|uniref:Jacalin-type lectin domain-containing protein n=1 Tax=Dendrobium nobile TaxID=94219 RepID=A0A8T3BU20_DENNO|nr:hypothetical protein KFK09_006270 [Dendrobium nobile]
MRFSIKCPLISVSGHYDSIFGYNSRLGEVPCIWSIKFKTISGETYGPYGLEIGIPFSYESDSKGLAGFHGKLRSDINFNYLSYLGVYVHSSATKAANSGLNSSRHERIHDVVKVGISFAILAAFVKSHSTINNRHSVAAFVFVVLPSSSHSTFKMSLHSRKSQPPALDNGKLRLFVVAVLGASHFSRLNLL